MERLIARVASVVAVAAAASFAMLGAGAASADPLIGKTYSDASGMVADQWNATPVIATVSGDQLSTDECIVSSWSRSSSIDALTGRNSQNVLLHLNCNAKVAEAGVPGNSAATPVGKQAKQDINRANSINDNPDACYKSDDNLTYCKRICQRTGLCEIE